MAKYKNGENDVEAFNWTGGFEQSEDPVWIVEALENGTAEIVYKVNRIDFFMLVENHNGIFKIFPGDYIIKYNDGSISNMGKEKFESLYYKVGE